MKILFIDYKALFTDGLVCLLESSGLEVEGIFASDVSSGLDKLAYSEHPDLIFLNINLYNGCADNLMGELQQLSALSPVIIISEIESPTFEKLTLDAGASGFICKANNKTTLLNAVDIVLKGGIYSNCHILDNDMKRFKSEVKITSRQYEILHLLSRGLLNKQIASALSISVNTVNAHLHEIFARLHVTNRTAAVQSAHKIGLL